LCYPDLVGLGVVVSPKFKRLAPFFLLGPVTGPLLAGVIFNFKDGRPVLGSLYGIALVQFVVLLPTITAKMTLALAAKGIVLPG
jgi:hypothetical protein